MPNNLNKPRIVIYGVGLFGQFITRFAVQKGWPIVAAYNRAGAKVGQDIGQLAGLDKDLGIIVQDCETACYDDVQADIGVVAVSNRLSENLPSYKRLLGAGMNVICHGLESCYPQGNDPVIAAEIDAIAKQNGVTYTGGGIWDMSRVWAGILLTGPCTEIKSIYHRTLTNTATVGKAAMMLTGTGFSIDQFNDQILNADIPPLFQVYKTVPWMVLDALGYRVTNTSVTIEPIVLDSPIDCPLLEREILPGECVGTRIVCDLETKEGVTAKAEVDLRLFRDDDVEHMFWSVDGLPVTRVRTERENSAHATAGCLFNRIPDVIAAQPGIVPVSKMRPLTNSALL